MEIEPIAHFHSPFATKFGIPKQSGLVDNLHGVIEFTPKYRNFDALRGLDGFDYMWLIWEFSANRHSSSSPVVRPPLLGGNAKVGVFATRSPFRPNRLGLSSVRMDFIEVDTLRGPLIHVLGADLMDGTPIYDIKPYVAYADSHPNAQCGFVDTNAIRRLRVVMPGEVVAKLKLSSSELGELHKVLALDPRPQYHNNADKVYGMLYGGNDVHFKVSDGVLTLI